MLLPSMTEVAARLEGLLLDEPSLTDSALHVDRLRTCRCGRRCRSRRPSCRLWLLRLGRVRRGCRYTGRRLAVVISRKHVSDVIRVHGG